jgi:hypothetical protein
MMGGSCVIIPTDDTAAFSLFISVPPIPLRGLYPGWKEESSIQLAWNGDGDQLLPEPTPACNDNPASAKIFPGHMHHPDTTSLRNSSMRTASIVVVPEST